jgi:hypothetical protein
VEVFVCRRFCFLFCRQLNFCRLTFAGRALNSELVPKEYSLFGLTPTGTSKFAPPVGALHRWKFLDEDLSKESVSQAEEVSDRRNYRVF